MKRGRVSAVGGFDHETVGLLSILFAVLMGVAGSLLSLLLRWPGLQHAGPLLHAAARAHVPLLVFFSAIPASLGGLAVLSIPGQVGSTRGVLFRLQAAGLGLTIAAACVFAISPLQSAPAVSLIAAANTLGLGAILTAATLVTLILSERSRSFADIPCSAWTTLIAASFVVCAAPIMVAADTVALWQGAAPEAAMAGSVWPALCAVLTLMIGLVSDIVLEDDGEGRSSASSRTIVWLLTIGVFLGFMAWAWTLLAGRMGTSAVRALHGASLLPILTVELIWARLLLRRRFVDKGRGGLPLLFALGFAVVLPLGLLGGLLGYGGHEAISVAVVFGLFAGFFRFFPVDGDRAVLLILTRWQFWLLLGGTVALLLPLPAMIEAMGAAMLSLSIGLFVLHLAAKLVRRGRVDPDRSATRTVRLVQERHS